LPNSIGRALGNPSHFEDRPAASCINTGALTSPQDLFFPFLPSRIL
jgi:hypothetical protein